LAHAFFEGGGAVLLGKRYVVFGVAVAACEQFPALIDDGNVIGRETCDGGRDEVLNRGDLSVADTRARLEHDGSRRGLVGLGEDLALRDDEMHAGRFDRIDRTDRARKFALECAQAVDVLHERAGAERVGLVKNLVADAGRRQAFSRELHADTGDLIGGNEDRAPVAPLFVGHIDRVEFGGNGARLARLESGIEDRHRRLGDHAKDVEEESGQCRGNARHGADTQSAQSSPEFRQGPLR
jgi:hypothetical protein